MLLKIFYYDIIIKKYNEYFFQFFNFDILGCIVY